MVTSDTYSSEKPVISIEKFPCLLLPSNAIVFAHLIIQFLFYYLSSGRLREVKNTIKFQTFNFKILQEVVAYKRFQIK